MNKRVVITGGTGLIGTALTKHLAQQGYHVIATGTSHGKEVTGDGVTLVTWNGRDTETLLPYLDGATAVIHLAGSPVNQRWTPRGKDAIIRSRIESGSALAASIRKTKKKPLVLIQASAIGYYGNTQEEIATEETSHGKGWLPYVCTHWEASTESVERLGVRRCIIRTAPVLARGGYLRERAKPFHWFLGGPLGTGEQWVSWIALTDVVRGIQFLIENKRARGTYNFTSPSPVKESHFARALGETLRRPCWLRTPQWALRMRFPAEQVDELLLASSRVKPERLIKAGFRFEKVAVEDALSDAA